MEGVVVWTVCLQATTPSTIRIANMSVFRFTSTRRKASMILIRRTVSGVFHHFSPYMKDLCFNEIGFR